ncbi:MAG TPA: hypothetical protein VJ739_17615 [Gemmataceae bacterium]|nr:hypothetical protein [Gemmataceae bacterium]
MRGPILTPESAFLGVIAAGLLLGYVLVAVWAPIRFRWRYWHAADPTYEPLDGDDLPPDVAGMLDVLAELDFVFLGHWQHAGNPSATAYVTVMEGPQTRDVAKVLEVTTATRRQVTLVFQTRFEDGTEVATTNSRLTTGLRSPPGITAVWLPQVRDVWQLYRVHSQVRDGLGAGKERLPVGPDPVAFLKAGSDRMFRHWLASGYYYLDEARGVYRPTWKGAVLMTWRLLRPVRPLYNAWRGRQTRKLLNALDIEVEPWD